MTFSSPQLLIKENEVDQSIWPPWAAGMLSVNLLWPAGGAGAPQETLRHELLGWFWKKKAPVNTMQLPTAPRMPEMADFTWRFWANLGAWSEKDLDCTTASTTERLSSSVPAFSQKKRMFCTEHSWNRRQDEAGSAATESCDRNILTGPWDTTGRETKHVHHIPLGTSQSPVGTGYSLL